MSSYHSQNLTDGRLPRWRHGRAWWCGLAWEWSVFYPIHMQSVSIGKWGFSIYLRWFSLHLAGRDGLHRRWEVSWHDQCFWIDHPWVRQMEWHRSDPWWKKTIVLHVVDWLLGRQKHELIQGEPFEVTIPMPEGSYRAVATPGTRTWRRRWYWPLLRRSEVLLDIPGGIPFSGKGENSWDCGDDGLFGCGGETVEGAIAHAVESVLKSRRRYGHDSKGTGKNPAAVLNKDED